MPGNRTVPKGVSFVGIVQFGAILKSRATRSLSFRYVTWDGRGWSKKIGRGASDIVKFPQVSNGVCTTTSQDSVCTRDTVCTAAPEPMKVTLTPRTWPRRTSLIK